MTLTTMFVFTIGDIVEVVIFGVVLLCFAFLYGSTAIKQFRCKHDGGVNETQACEAICRRCGKNLGFIGTWRQRITEKE